MLPVAYKGWYLRLLTLPLSLPPLLFPGHLSRSAKLTFFDDLVQHGNAVWLDPKAKQRCLVLWKSATEWADTLYTWALDNGLRDSVVTVDEVILGEDSAGTELHGMHREVFERAVKVLEAQRRAK